MYCPKTNSRHFFFNQQNVMKELLARIARLLVIALMTQYVIISTVAVLAIYVRLVGRVATVALVRMKYFCFLSVRN